MLFSLFGVYLPSGRLRSSAYAQSRATVPLWDLTGVLGFPNLHNFSLSLNPLVRFIYKIFHLAGRLPFRLLDIFAHIPNFIPGSTYAPKRLLLWHPSAQRISNLPLFALPW